MKSTTKLPKYFGRKVLTVVIFLIAAGNASAATRNEPMRIIAEPGDFAALNSVQSPKVTIFLSYAGEQWNHCGVTVRFSRIAPVEEFNRQIAIKNRGGVEVGEIENGRVIAKVEDRTAKLFGEMFDFESKSGQNISDVLHGLDGGQPTDAIVEILGCESAKSAQKE